MPPPRRRPDDAAPRGNNDRAPLKGKKAERQDDSDEGPVAPPPKRPAAAKDDDSSEELPARPVKKAAPARPPITPPGGARSSGMGSTKSGQGAERRETGKSTTKSSPRPSSSGGGGSRTKVAAGAVALLIVVAVGAALLLGPEEPPPTIPTGPRPGGPTSGGPDDPGRPGPGVGVTTSPVNPSSPTTPGALTPPDGPTPTTDPRRPPVSPSSPSPTSPGPGGPRGPTGTTAPAAPANAVPLTLRCRDAQGQPLTGVTIDVTRAGGAPLGQVVSNAEGEARYVGLPAGERVAGAARHPLSRETVVFGPIELTTNAVVTLKFERAATGRLRGRIVDGDGQAVRDAALVVVDPKQQGEAILDAFALGLGPDGTFTATLAAGQYAVNARGPGFSPSDKSYVTVTVDADAGPIDLMLLRQGRISGVVSLPPDLTAVLPVKLDLVLELTRGTEQNPWKTVDRRPVELDSRFEFVLDGCDPGMYRIRVEAPAAGQNRVGPWVMLTLTPGLEAKGVTLVLAEVQSSVRGTIRDDRGDPVEGVQISCRGRRATTDREGRYALAGLDEGEIAIEAKKKGYADVYQRATYAGPELLIDIRMSRNGGVRGRISDRAGPVPSCPVAIVMQNADGTFTPFQVATTAQGEYVLEDLPPGAYFVKAGPGMDAFDPTGGTGVQVRPGEVVEVQPITLP